MAFKMNGAGKVYYEGSGDPINLNPNDLIKLKGDEKYDEHGNEQWMHKETKDIFYEKKPRGESEIKEGEGPKTPKYRPIEGERFFA